MPQAYDRRVDLRLCAAGTAAEIRWVDLDEEERVRLRDLGVREGAVVHVIHCGAFGARVIAVGSDRLALDGRTCACIGVLPLDAARTPALAGSRP